MSSNANHQGLLDRIRTKRAKIGVIGLGYVGLPLAVEFARQGFDVSGFDVDECKTGEINAGPELHPGRLRGGVERGRQGGPVARHNEHGRPRQHGRHRHLRADAAPEDEGSGSVLRRARRRSRGRDAQKRPADHSRVNDLSRHDRRSRPADAREPRRQGGRRLLPRLLARARGSGQPEIQHPQHSQGRGRCWRREHRGGRPALRIDRRHRRAGQLDASRRDGEAAREHFPRGQHRHGQRARADVPQDGHRRVGSDRCGEDQAVRVHAVLPRSRAGRPLHSDRSVLSLVEGAAERLRMPVHRARRAA